MPKASSVCQPCLWSPEATHCLRRHRSGNAVDVLVLPLKGERKPIPLVHTRFYEGSPKFSPDGKWVAYCSGESGRAEVYVQPFPVPGPRSRSPLRVAKTRSGAALATSSTTATVTR